MLKPISGDVGAIMDIVVVSSRQLEIRVIGLDFKESYNFQNKKSVVDK
jgi:hypothetical protein